MVDARQGRTDVRLARRRRRAGLRRPHAIHPPNRLRPAVRPYNHASLALTPGTRLGRPTMNLIIESADYLVMRWDD